MKNKPEKAVFPARMALMAVYIMPMAVIAFIFAQYIYPMFTSRGDEVTALGLSAMLTLAVILSILGLVQITKVLKKGSETLSGMDMRMQSLLGAARSFNKVEHVDMLVDSIAKAAKELLDAEASSLLLYDSKGSLRFEYVEGPASHALKGKELKDGEGITGWAAREGKPLLINSVQMDPRFEGQFDRESGFKTKSIICVPLIFNGHRLGALDVMNKRDGSDFTEEDLKTVASLSEHAAGAIYKNKVFDEMKGDFVQIMDILMVALENMIANKRGHSRRVAYYSIKLAKGLGLTEEEVRKVYFGALLHDVGFLKFGFSNLDEKKYKLHPVVGAEMVKNITQWKDVAPIIHDHHERYDGAGYPERLAGAAITLGGRIVALAEAFDVMTNAGSYRPTKLDFNEAKEEIAGLAGSQFDPEVVKVFIRDFRREDLLDMDLAKAA